MTTQNNECDAIMCAYNPAQEQLEKNLWEIKNFYECVKEKIPPNYRLKDIINILDICYETLNTGANIQTIYYYYNECDSYKMGLCDFITIIGKVLENLLTEPIFLENKYLTTKLTVLHSYFNWRGNMFNDYYKIGNCYEIGANFGRGATLVIGVCVNNTDKSYVFQYLDNYGKLRNTSIKKNKKDEGYTYSRYFYTDTDYSPYLHLKPLLEQWKKLDNYMCIKKNKLWKKMEEQRNKFLMY